MKLKNRLVTAAVTIALVTGGGLVAAAPAQAIPASGVHYVDGYSLSNCKSIFNSGIREKLMFGKKVYDQTDCFQLPSGTWRAIYRWKS